jgi:hypothetical protein
MVDADVLAAFDLERVVVAAEIDRKAAAARGLAADRAVAEVERIGVGASGVESAPRRRDRSLPAA